MDNEPFAAERLSIAVLGPGGIGGMVAALAARAGHDVTVVARDETAAALREGGIGLSSERFGEVSAEVRAEAALGRPVDVVVVATKQTSLDDALERLDPAAVGDALVVPLLNGVEHVDLLRARYQNVVAGVIRASATRTAPGRITHRGQLAEIDLASRDVPRERLDTLAAALGRTGITTTVHDDETAMLWSKLALLAPWALLSSVHRVPIGELRTTHRAELLELVGEVAGVARAAAGIETAERSTAFYDSFPAEVRSSMQVDADAGLPLETDAIGGAVVRAAERHDVGVPAVRRTLSALEPA